MAVLRGQRFPIPFEDTFPQGLYLVGEIAPLTEYQSQEDKARNRPVRPRTDEATGLPLFRGTFADPSAEKDRDKSISVEFVAKVQPVPPPAAPGMPFVQVVLDGLTVQPRAETSGQAKWITWTFRATGMSAVGSKSTSPGKSAASAAQGEQKAA
jgi:hypothetical protein